jgi:hypothetical protein
MQLPRAVHDSTLHTELEVPPHLLHLLLQARAVDLQRLLLRLPLDRAAEGCNQLFQAQTQNGVCRVLRRTLVVGGLLHGRLLVDVHEDRRVRRGGAPFQPAAAIELLGRQLRAAGRGR